MARILIATVDLRTKTPTPRRILEAFRALVSEPRYRQNARRLRDEIARTNAATGAAQVLEQLASSARIPVIEQQVQMGTHIRNPSPQPQTGVGT